MAGAPGRRSEHASPDPAFQPSERFFPISPPAAAARNAPLSQLLTSDRCGDRGESAMTMLTKMLRCRSGRLRPKTS